MKEPIFVDTSAWIAITNRRDGYHKEADGIFRGLLRDKRLLLTTNWTAYEALSVIKAKAGYVHALSLWKKLNTLKVVTIIWISRDMESTGLEMFFRYKDKTWGVVDCVSFVVMEKLGCREAFAFDKHFRERELLLQIELKVKKFPFKEVLKWLFGSV